MIKIMLFGKNGQVGFCLQQSLSKFTINMPDSKTVNFMDLKQLSTIIQEYKPNIIINAAAYTAVDNAEKDSALAYQINTYAVAILAQEAKNLNAWLIHYSTDYVFDGYKDCPYIETDITNPLNIYGNSKLDGELAIITTQCNYIILRSSWIYSHRRNNFPLAILKRALKNEQLKIVNGNIGAPTNAQLIANITNIIIHKIIKNDFTQDDIGIYHITAQGETTWFDFAQLLINQAESLNILNKKSILIPIMNANYKYIASRPINSRLNTNKISEKLNVILPNWKTQAITWIQEYYQAITI